MNKQFLHSFSALKIKVLFCFFLPFFLHANEISIQSFETKNNGKPSHNHEVIFEATGLLYVANETGLLCYDGIKWTKIPLPNAISLCFNKDNYLFVGAKNEFGYCSRNQYNQLQYNSLVDSIPFPHQKNFGVVQYCCFYKDKVYFLTENKLFIFDGKKIQVMLPEKGNKFNYIGKYNNTLYLFEQGKGLSFLGKNGFRLFSTNCKDLDIKCIERTRHMVYYLYASNGVYEIKNGIYKALDTLDFLKGSIITDVLITKKGKLISTKNNGVFVVSDKFKLLSHYTAKNYQITGSTNAVGKNRNGDVCLTSDKGIKLLHYKASIFCSDSNQILTPPYGKIKIEKIQNCRNDSLLHLKNIYLPSSQNSLRIFYSYSAIQKFYDIQCYYMLSKGKEEGLWKKGNKKQVETFLDLPDGIYHLKLKAVSNKQVLDEMYIYFTISPPWYRSPYALIFYALLFFEAFNRLKKYWKKRKTSTAN